MSSAAFMLCYSILSFCDEHLVRYPATRILNVLWSFGFLSLFTLVIQIVSGVFLATHYVQDVEFAFSTVENVVWEVNSGWFFWYVHMFGASLFFVAVYSHICRGLILKSYVYPWNNIWISGSFIFVLLMGIAFLGYSLPWGQMSFWGVTVITSLATVIPVVGSDIVMWVWGDFIVSATTLKRFFILHFLLPFVLLVLVAWHILELHKIGSWSPYYDSVYVSTVNYSPLSTAYVLKDLRIFINVVLVFCFLLQCAPDVVTHTINSDPADALDTPEHIVPEWYFLPYYAVLWSIHDKAVGFLAMVFMLCTVFIVSILADENRMKKRNVLANSYPSRTHKYYCYCIIYSYFLLGYLGASAPIFVFSILTKLIFLNVIVAVATLNDIDVR